MHRKKKIISALTALALSLCAVPASAKSDDLMIVNNWHLDFRDRDKSCSNDAMGWEWNARSKTLMLEDFRVQVPQGEMEGQAAVFLPPESTITLVGDANEIHARSYDCTPIYCEGRLTFAGRGSLKITTDSRAASGIFVEQGPLVFSESVEITFDPAGYIFTLNDVKGGEAVLSVQDKAKVIFPDDHTRAIAVTHDSSVKSKNIAYEYDQDIDREAGTVTLLKSSAEPAAEESEEPAEQTTVFHEYRFTIGSPVVLRDGIAVMDANAAPYLSGGYTMLPLRALDAVTSPEPGLELEAPVWDSAARILSISYTNLDAGIGNGAVTYLRRVSIFPDKAQMCVAGGEPVPLSASAELKGGRAFVSLRDLAKALELLQIDCEIQWDSATKTAVLTIWDTAAE